jgi:DNA invertase Pin-like site-specific DNA recombinase
MIQQKNGLAIAKPKGKYTGELLLRTRPKVYRQIIRLLRRFGKPNL